MSVQTYFVPTFFYLCNRFLTNCNSTHLIVIVRYIILFALSFVWWERFIIAQKKIIMYSKLVDRFSEIRVRL